MKNSRFFLLETLAEEVADLCLERFSLPEVGVSVHKPGALRSAENVGITIRRKRGEVKRHAARLAYLCIGSNIRAEEYVT